MQRAKQEHFQDRAAYYSSFLIQDQAKKWDFELSPIYFIGILDFSLASFPDDNYLHFGQITDIHSQKVMFEKLNFIYIEMAKFKKAESELSGHLEWSLYFLRELVTFDDVPAEFQGDVIEGAFELAKLANMSVKDRHDYELSLKYYRDFMNVLDNAKKEGIELGREKGLEEGREQGLEQGKWLERVNLAKIMLQEGLAIESVIKITGLSQKDILK